MPSFTDSSPLVQLNLFPQADCVGATLTVTKPHQRLLDSLESAFSTGFWLYHDISKTSDYKTLNEKHVLIKRKFLELS